MLPLPAADTSGAKRAFNRGDAAYKADDYLEAEDAYRHALETPDLNVQEQSYYNLGNTEYRHGGALLAVDSGKTIQLWEDALHAYECALQLKPAADTQHNYEVVKRKLEQLKQQPPRQGGQSESSHGSEGESGSGAPRPSDHGQAGAGEAGDDHPSDAKKPGEAAGTQKTFDGATDGQAGSPTTEAGTGANGTLKTYSGTRGEDLKDPAIRSRQEAENLLDSLKDDERHVTARALKSDGQNEPPPSGKDW